MKEITFVPKRKRITWQRFFYMNVYKFLIFYFMIFYTD